MVYIRDHNQRLTILPMDSYKRNHYLENNFLKSLPASPAYRQAGFMEGGVASPLTPLHPPLI